ncbi:hypothetical protein KP509_09G008100 [Ceratopteris richardii]|uniref:RING-type E3 ubiquitin transferase n=1 Tax=Ceratopteris richardii TaxID=49495 RepID=A0A8T2U032_CERRI|nr:hypothetical protein KP509_09G008100 [Ceratopteris richardii]
MSRDGGGNALLAPISEVLSRLLAQILTTTLATKDVVIEQSNFNVLSRFLERIAPILKELQEKNVRDKPSVRTAIESLEHEIRSANELISECTNKSRVYLLYSCKDIVRRLQGITHEIGRCLSRIPMATLDITLDMRDTTVELCKLMQNVGFKTAAAQEEIIAKLDAGIRDGQSNRDHAREVLHEIAQAVGISDTSTSWKREFEKLKEEKEEAILRKSQAEAFQLEQILNFLSQAEAHHLESKKQQILPGPQPLQAFYCPMTHEVMDDPVEIASGLTVERKAIEEWFRTGHRTCPITNAELTSLEIHPNTALCSCIRDWRNRMVHSQIIDARSKLKTGSDEDKITALKDLHRLSEGAAICSVWIQEEGLVPVISTLLSNMNKHQHLRQTALATLNSLATNNRAIKEEISHIGAMQNIVRSLARDVKEGRQAVSLLLELSKEPSICERIGKVQGCILLLVTMLNCGNSDASEDAKKLLQNLASNNQNVVQMAEANYFKPLVHLLLKGPEMTKVLMATALAKMALTEQSKAAIAREGAIPPLVKLMSAGKLEAKTAALGVLQSLSTHPDNRDLMIDAGVIPPLLQLLFSVTSVFMNLKELAAETLANLATVSSMEARLLESNETICQLLSLLNLVGPVNQGHLLRALNGMASPMTLSSVRARLREASAIQLLLPFCEANDADVRVNALKILHSLSQDWVAEDFADHFGLTYIKALVKLLASSSNDEKVAAAGILSNLPLNDFRITEMLKTVDAIPALIKLMNAENLKHCGRMHRDQLMETSARTLRRFTLPTDEKLQHMTAERNAIPLLVQVLTVGSSLAKREAAMVLSQLSVNSKRLSSPIRRKQGLLWCFSPRVQEGCRIHMGYCSVKSSFCLLEAGAVAPLVQALEETETHEAALGALATLIKDDTCDVACEIIAEAGGLKALVSLLTAGTPDTKSQVTWMLEKFFRMEKYRTEFGNSAQMPLIDLAQRAANNDTRSMAAKCLAHLNILHNQSVYF